MKSWISSAFEDSSASDASSKTARREVKKPAGTSEKSRINSSDAQIEANPLPFFNKENERHRFASQANTKQLNNGKSNDGQSLCDKYEPKSRVDLVVNKAKVDQLSNILEDLIKKQKGSILVIEGPSGSGKNVIFQQTIMIFNLLLEVKISSGSFFSYRALSKYFAKRRASSLLTGTARQLDLTRSKST
jgi:hypothetical protein